MPNIWFNKFKNTVVDVSKKTGKNVNCMVNVKKTELEIAKVNHEIGKILKAIGEIIYNCRDTEKDSSNIEILCKQIDVKKAYIKELEKRIELIKENKKLEEFELAELDSVPNFIKDEETDTEIAVLKFCPDCNTGNEIERKTCKNCGKRLSKKNIELK